MSPKAPTLLVLLLLMEVLAGFSVAVGSSLLDATSLQYGMFWLVLLVGLAGIAVTLGVGAARLPEPWDRVVLVGAGAVGALLPARLVSTNVVSFLTATVLLGIAYWRGATIAQETPDYTEVQARFGIGFGILFTGLVWVVARGVIYRSAIWHMLALDGIVYTIAAMTALVLARIDRTREPGSTQAVVLAVALQLGLLAIVSLAALLIFSHDLASSIFNLTRPVWDAAGAVTMALLRLLFAPIVWLIDLLHGHAHPHKFSNPAPSFTPHGDVHKRLHSNRTSDTVVTIAGFLFILGLLGLVGWLIWYTVPRLPRPHRHKGYAEERRSELSLSAIWRSLLRFIRGLIHRGAVAATTVASATRTRIFGPVYPEDPVRRIYAQILYRAHSLGVIRPTYATPAEFQQRLCATWPDGSADFSALTAAYESRRYGDAGLPSGEIETLRERWGRLRMLMRRQAVVPVVVAPEVSIAATPRSRFPMPALLRESQTIRQLAMELSGAAIAIVLIFVFVIGMVVVAIVLSGK